ncbi:MAG: S8 family peptidase [Elusimicrobia bacterium]|nr:S8 family peptidase [Elusimicrobiota bacterium]
MKKITSACLAVFVAGLTAGLNAEMNAVETLALSQVPDQKIIVFKNDNLRWEQKEQIILDSGGRPGRRIPLINAVVGYFPEGASPELDYDPNIMLVADDDYALMVGNFPAERDGLGPAPMFNPPVTPSEQEVPWGIERVGAPLAWEQAQGRGIKVCIIDSGVDVSHPDLAGNVMGGVSLVESTTTPTADIEDGLGHGTHVNGIIAAMNNATGVVGAAPNASLYQSKVFGSSGYTSISIVIAGVDYCASIGAQVINMSLGSSRKNDALELAIKKAHAAGIVIVAAAGNDYGRPVSYPAAYPEVIAVSASNINNALADFSSKGPEVDVIAPGDDILSTFKGGVYRELSGTSMASPHVAGVAALILSRNSALSNVQVKSIIEETATNLELPADSQGRGLVNALKAVEKAGDSALGQPRYLLAAQQNSAVYIKTKVIPDNAFKLPVKIIRGVPSENQVRTLQNIFGN